ncbi:Cas10/Cmr2 second palm domain-containing protein [Buchananella hordeovulneris]|uniref:Cas10/Cmr2 second palm domain-containing protein n=1 Tax=Buchananella hordeovulneris TaxID=52770 RepID=UPI000F5EBF0B|nr:hypothetical protein [Buchananella hordeovulneris]RRD42424.1 hypothetical protein EII13_09570 [Buchananella hordeovulneris]
MNPAPDEDRMYLVLLETSGNQGFVFSSPRQRENIGASWLLTRLPCWVRQELSEQQLAGLTKEECWVTRTSGKVIVRLPTENHCRELVTAVTKKAAAEAPGLAVAGVWERMPSKHVTQKEIRSIHELAARHAASRPPSVTRFAQLPFLQPAQDSTEPASGPLGCDGEANQDKQTPLSLGARIRRHHAHDFREYFAALAAPEIEELLKGKLARHSYEQSRKHLAAQRRREYEALQKQVEDLRKGVANILFEDESTDVDISRAAVIHIDGNGIGALMTSLADKMKSVPATEFDQHCGGLKAEDPDAFRLFSLAVSNELEEATRRAFVAAWAEVAYLSEQEHKGGLSVVPVVPVLLGGDDVTVITNGDYALPFVERYLTEFADQTRKQDGLLRYLTDEAGLTAGAGIAVVGAQFPFHLAYTLAEKLAADAKKYGKELAPARSTLNFHLLRDTTILDPVTLVESYARLTNRPYHLGEDERGWQKMCELTAFFSGARPVSQTTAHLTLADRRFPTTRAVRIRRLLAQAASATGETQAELEAQIKAEWQAVPAELAELRDKISDPKHIYDLLELSELLPTSYLSPSASTSASTGQQGSDEPGRIAGLDTEEQQ